MSVLFFARAGLQAEYIAAELERQGLIEAIVFESGGAAKLRKLYRMFKGNPVRWPARVRDVLALQSLRAGVDQYLSSRIESAGGGGRAFKIPVETCGDANDERAVEVLRKYQPQTVLLYGTSILKTSTLQLAPRFLNIHGGLVPKYRNVHSEFWALMHGKSEEIGTSILQVTPGIDDGPVVIQKALPMAVSTLEEALHQNLLLGAQLAAEALRAARAGTLRAIPQDAAKRGFFKTPGYRDIQQFREKIGRKS